MKIVLLLALTVCDLTWCLGPIHITKVTPHGLPDDDEWEHTIILARSKTMDFVFDCRSPVVHSMSEAKKYAGAREFCPQFVPGLEFTPDSTIINDFINVQYPNKEKAPDGSPYIGPLHSVSLAEREQPAANDKKNTKKR